MLSVYVHQDLITYMSFEKCHVFLLREFCVLSFILTSTKEVMYFIPVYRLFVRLSNYCEQRRIVG